MPDIPAPGPLAATFTARWLAGGEPLSVNTLDLLLGAGALREERIPVPTPRSSNSRPGSAVQVLTRMGIACERIWCVPDAVPERTLLIVGPDSLRHLTEQDQIALNGIARQGATVLVLEQDVYHPDRDEISLDWLDGTPLRILREGMDVDDFVQVRAVPPGLRGASARAFPDVEW